MSLVGTLLRLLRGEPSHKRERGTPVPIDPELPEIATVDGVDNDRARREREQLEELAKQNERRLEVIRSRVRVMTQGKSGRQDA